MRALVLVLLLGAALPATASAAPFGELPFRPVAGSAKCLDTTGAPGELVRDTDSGSELLRATATGLTSLGTAAPAGEGGFLCAHAATAASGAGVIAQRALSIEKGTFSVAAQVRDPGGAWSPAQSLAGSKGDADSLAAAVSEHGDGAVAWTQADTDDDVGPHRLLLARRAPGGPLGAPVVVARSKAGVRGPGVRLAYSADGGLIAVWWHEEGSGVV